MITPEVRAINRDLWEQRRLPSTERGLLEFYAGKTPSDVQAQTVPGTSLESIAFTLSHEVFGLMVGEREDLIVPAADLLIQVGEEALRTESFNRLYYAVDPRTNTPLDRYGPLPENAILPTPKQIRIEKMLGRKETLELLHYGLWFKSDRRPIDVLREAVEIGKGVDRPPDDFDLLVMNAVQSEDYEYAISMCKKKARKAVLPPSSGHFKQNRNYVLYILSEYALGDASLERFAREGVEYWYERSMKWLPLDPTLPWDTRLGWAYLRGKHFTGITGARALIRELRGY